MVLGTRSGEGKWGLRGEGRRRAESSQRPRWELAQPWAVLRAGRRLVARLLPSRRKHTSLSFHINKTFNRFLANWQEKCM